MPPLTVVIPCFNEAATIEQVVERVALHAPPGTEVIVVDDASTDGTAAILRDRVAGRAARVFFHETNRGKGAALRTAFAAASGDVVLVQDADLEYDPRDYAKILAPIVEGRADVVFGSRFVGGDSHRVLYFWHSVGNRFLTLVSNMFTNLNLTDMEAGYKAFRRDVLMSLELREDRFGFEPEITARVAHRKCRIFEVGITYSGRTYAEGKKVGWKDGVRALWCIVKYNVFAR